MKNWQKLMDEFELIRWLDVLLETGIIQRWQTMLWSELWSEDTPAGC